MSRRPRKPIASIIVIVDRFSDRETIKRIKNSARTSSLVTQHFARQPDLFVYRVNVYAKANAHLKPRSSRLTNTNSR